MGVKAKKAARAKKRVHTTAISKPVSDRGPRERGPSERMILMSEATANPKTKSKSQPFPASVFPGVEAPAAFRDMAEKSLSQAKDNYEKMKTAAEEATGVLEDTYATASKGAADYTLKLLEMARENTNATFDFAVELLGAKTLSEVIEMSVIVSMAASPRRNTRP